VRRRWTLDLRNRTPYPHLPAVLHDEHGREVLVVLLKATLRLSNGAPHPEPLLVHTADVRFSSGVRYPARSDGDGDDGDGDGPWSHFAGHCFSSGEVRYPSDLVPAKIGTDIVCNGQVHAPGGIACTDCTAELSIGALHREVRAVGPRRSPEASPEPFVRVPLGREHAPGLAALGPHDEPRRSYRGTFDEAWERTRAPLLPEDMDARFWNAAQLVSARRLVGGEPIVLVNLSPTGRIEARLPRVPLRLRVDDREVRPDLDLVVIEPDDDRVALTFRVSVDVTGRLDRRMPKVRIVEKRCALLGRKEAA